MGTLGIPIEVQRGLGVTGESRNFGGLARPSRGLFALEQTRMINKHVSPLSNVFCTKALAWTIKSVIAVRQIFSVHPSPRWKLPRENRLQSVIV